MSDFQSQINILKKQIEDLERKILTGSKSGRWKPVKGQTYYWVGAHGKVVFETWEGRQWQLDRWEVDNCFKSEKEAEDSWICKAYDDKYIYWIPGRDTEIPDDHAGWEGWAHGFHNWYLGDVDHREHWENYLHRKLKPQYQEDKG